MAPDQAAGQARRHRPRQRAARDLRRSGRCPRLRLRARHALAAGSRGVVPVRGNARSAPGHGRGQTRHGSRPADGPPGRGRRWLRQDRGRAAGRVQGDTGRQASGRSRADDRPGRPALRHVLSAVRRISGDGAAAVALRPGPRAGDHHRRPGLRFRRPRHRHPSPAQQGRPLPRPGHGHRRRGATLRGCGEGAAQEAAPRGGRADALRHADPADAQPGPCRCPRPLADRDAA